MMSAIATVMTTWVMKMAMLMIKLVIVLLMAKIQR